MKPSQVNIKKKSPKPFPSNEEKYDLGEILLFVSLQRQLCSLQSRYLEASLGELHGLINYRKRPEHGDSRMAGTVDRSMLIRVSGRSPRLHLP